MDNVLYEELRENNRLLRALACQAPTVHNRVTEAYSKRLIDNLNLQHEWAERYGECVPVHVAAKIVGKTPGCIQQWAQLGKVIKSETGGILTRSLAAYIQGGIPQGRYADNPHKPMRRSRMKAE